MHQNLPIFIAICVIVSVGVFAFVVLWQGGSLAPVTTASNMVVPEPEELQEIVLPSAADEVDDSGDDIGDDDAEEDRVRAVPKEPVKPMYSKRSGLRYYVAARLAEDAKALEHLEAMQDIAVKMTEEVQKRLATGEKIIAHDKTDITENMRVLIRKHHNKPLNLAEYHHPTNRTVGSNTGKGALIEVCLRSKRDPTEFNKMNTLCRVFLHEMAHSADFELRKDGRKAHGPEFERLHMYLLGVAEDLHLYSCEEYQKNGDGFCGLSLGEQYCRE